MLLIDFLLEPSRLGWGYWNAGPYNSEVGSSKYVFTSNVLLTMQWNTSKKSYNALK